MGQSASAGADVRQWLACHVRNRVLCRRYQAAWDAWIRQLPAPERVQPWVIRMGEDPALRPWLLEMFHHQTLPSFLLIIAYSPFLGQRLLSHPAYFKDLFRPSHVYKTLTGDEWFEQLERFLLLHSTLDLATALALFRQRSWASILVADLRGDLSLVEVTEQLSRVADAVVRKAFEVAAEEVRRHYDTLELVVDGRPWAARLAVFALGKWGGLELNYSSDLDLVCLTEWSQELPEAVRGTLRQRLDYWIVKMLDALRSYTSVGRAYRVDLRLRPLGREGELVVPLHQARAYYANWADIWERQALLKCRFVCGDATIGRRWLRQVRRLIEHAPDPESLVRSLNRLREGRFRQLGDAAARHVKEGPGGIRDLELLVQALLWTHLREHPLLRQQNTLKALAALRDVDRITATEYRSLSEAYQFLRRCEHILQMAEDQQQFTLPADVAEREVFARKMGFSGEEAWSDFWRTYLHHTQTVSGLWHDLLNRMATGTFQVTVPAFPQDDAKLQERWRALYREEPYLEVWMKESVWREWLIRVIAAPIFSELRHHLIWLARLLRDHPGVAQHLADRPGWVPIIQELLVVSPVLAEALWRFGRLLEERSVLQLFDSGANWAEWLSRGTPDPRDWSLARRVRAMELVLGLLEFSKTLPLSELLRLVTLKSERVLQMTWDRIFRTQLAAQTEELPDWFATAPPVWIVGLGRMGTYEMDWGSDADLVVLRDAPAWRRAGTEIRIEPWVRAWIEDLTRWSKWGYLLNADLRLRPFGRAGELVVDSTTVLEYFARGARVWEMLAFLKARRIYGYPEAFDAWMEELRDIWQQRGWGLDDVRREWSQLKEQWAAAYPAEDLKYGIGGWMTWWGLVHLYQFETEWWQGEFWKQQRPSPVWCDEMERDGWLTSAEAEAARTLFEVLHLWRHMGFRSQRWNQDDVDRLSRRLEAAQPPMVTCVRLWPERREILEQALRKRLRTGHRA